MTLQNAVATWVAMERMKRDDQSKHQDPSKCYDPDLDLRYDPRLLIECREELTGKRIGKRSAAAQLLAIRADRYLQHRVGLEGGVAAVAEIWRRRVKDIVIVAVIIAFFLGLLGGFGGPLFIVDAQGKLAVRSAILAVLIPSVTLLYSFWILANTFVRAALGLPTGEPSLVSRAISKSLDWLRRRTSQLGTNVKTQNNGDWSSVSSLLASQPRIGALAAQVLVNTCAMFLFATALVMAQLQIAFDGFDVSWKHNLATNADAAGYLRLINLPLFGAAPIPSEDAIRWANANAEAPNESAIKASWELQQHELEPRSKEWTIDERERRWREEMRHRTDLAQIYRHQWSTFFMHLAIGYWIVWRLILMLLAVVAIGLCRRDFEPRLDDPYFRSILARIVDPPFLQFTEAPVESPNPEPTTQGNDTTYDKAVHSHAPVTSSPIVADPSPQNLTDSRFLSSRPHELWIVGYQTKPPRPPPSELQSLGGALRDMGEVDGTDEVDAFLKHLHDRVDNVKLLIIVAALDSTPDGAWRDFLRRIAYELTTPSKLAILLTNGRRMYERWPGNRDNGDHRLRLWRDERLPVAIEESHVYEFDIEHATRESEQQLARTIFTWLGHSGPGGTAGLAGRYPSAFQKVRAFANGLEVDESGDELQRRTCVLLSELLELYRVERRSVVSLLLNSSASFPGLTEEALRTIYAGVERGRQFAEDPAGKLLRLAAIKARELVSDHPVWTTAAGLAVGAILCLPAVPVLGLASLPAGMTAGGAAAFAIRGKLALGNPKGDLIEKLAPEHDERWAELDDKVRTAIVMIGTLELQGFGEAKIAALLTTFTNALPTSSVTRKEDALALIDEAERQLRQLGGAEAKST